MNYIKNLLLPLILLILIGCKTEHEEKETFLPARENIIPVEYAEGFSLSEYDGYKILTVENPWPEAERSYRYLLLNKNATIPEGIQYDQKIIVPVEKIVVTSTTHIPSLEILEVEQTLVGFPGLDYISSEGTRARIAEGKIKEVGKNEALNTEILLNLQPDVVIGFSIDGSNKSLNTIQKSGIPVVFNADWTENSPLGKAEWIKFFSAFYNKTTEAVEFFNKVETAYIEAKKLAKGSASRPTVLAGSMYKDQWYLPYGNSWHAKFIDDANAQYVYEDTKGAGSMSLSFESVLEKARDADFWVGPAQFESYREMLEASPHYGQFSAFQERNVYTFSSEKGETGGVLFYELAPNRPDLVLKDLISIFHPGLLQEYETTFYKPLH